MSQLCETASRLLFLTVHWLKRIPQIELRFEESDLIQTQKDFYSENSLQEEVLKERWCELFLLGLLQCADKFQLMLLLESVGAQLHTMAMLGKKNFRRNFNLTLSPQVT